MRALKVSPAFREFAPGNSPNDDSSEFDLPLILPIRCPPHVSHHHLISLRDYVLNGYVNIRKTPEGRRQILFGSFRPSCEPRGASSPCSSQSLAKFLSAAVRSCRLTKSSKWRRTKAFASSVVMLPQAYPGAKEQSNAARTSTDNFSNRLFFSGCFRSRPP